MAAEVNRIHRIPEDHQDVQLALQIVGMGPTEANPAPEFPDGDEFIDRVNALLTVIAPSNFNNLPAGYQRDMVKYRAGTAVRKVLDAIYTIADFQNDGWPDYWTDTHTFQITSDDRPQDALPWHLLDDNDPMTLADFQAHKAALDLKEMPDSFARLTGPTLNECNQIKARRAAMMNLDPFVVQHIISPELSRARVMVNGAVHELNVVPVMGDGNCYWYAVSQSLHNDWRRFAEVKANILKYFRYVLTHPTHPRYRTYWILQRRSRSFHRIPGNGGAVGPQKEFSIQRCLHNNDGNRSMWRPFRHLGLNQVVADFYRVEIVEFEDPGDWRPRISAADVTRLRGTTVQSEDGQYYIPRVRGRQDSVRQIILFKEGDHVSAGSLTDEFRAQIGWRYPTHQVPNHERWEAMPWYTLNAQQNATVNIPANHLPSQLGLGIGVNGGPQQRAGNEEPPYVEGGRNFPSWHYEDDEIKGVTPPATDVAMLSWDSQEEPPEPPGWLPSYELYDAADGPDVGNISPLRWWLAMRLNRSRHRGPRPEKRATRALKKKRDTTYRPTARRGGFSRSGPYG